MIQSRRRRLTIAALVSPTITRRSLMHWMRRLTFTVLAVVLCNACYGQDAASVEKIWRTRQERIKDLHLKWTEQSTHYTLPGETAEREAEFAISTEGRFLAVGDSYQDAGRFGPGGPPKGVDPKTIQTSRQTCVDAYDGVTLLKLFSPRPEAQHHALFISPGVSGFRFRGMVLNKRAAEWFCRPFTESDNALRGGLAGFRSRPDELDEEKCLLLEDDKNSIWVTADDRALMLRTTSKKAEGTPSHDIRVRYAQDKLSNEWLPSGWDFTYYGIDGKFILETRTARVTKASVHVPLPVELFQVKIPDGTWVTETVDRKQTVYIHREKKGPRYILPGEFTGDNYEALLNSESGTTKPSPATKKAPAQGALDDL
ncbi:hypothetical protein AYO47_00140 [Planctomyces sp. SCGC AG-212-M04]|nr:hypothetical protein AYO47_00140 [Planctomyces sp. SCGC AG-212-M04]